MASLKTAQIHALTTTELSVLTTTQLAVWSMTQVKALSSLQLSSMSSDQQNALAKSPLVLDLTDHGIDTVNVAAGVSFDLTGSGHKLNTGWITSSEGFLVYDPGHSGVINDGTQLFGTSTRLPNGTLAPNGFAALAAYDSNHDGVIDAKDASFSALAIWVDSNQDGVSQTGEVHTLSSLNITKIDLNAVIKTSILNNQNWIGLESTYLTADGKSHTIADVWFLAGNGLSQTLDLTQPDSAGISAGSLGHINLAGYGSQGGKLILNAGNVLYLGGRDLVNNAQTGSGHVQMVISGNASDTVQLTDPHGSWSDGGTTELNQLEYHIYLSGTVQLLVQNEVKVDLA
jgi:hypothetical protein